MAATELRDNYSFQIGDTSYNRANVLVIAEIGTAHGGDIVKARELIRAALDSGADVVKFQHVYADEILAKNSGKVLLPNGSIELYQAFKRLEQPIDFFKALKETVEDNGGIFLCTAFGLQSAREIQSLQPRLLKIASPELNHFELLEETASYRLPTILSTGVSKLADIEQAVQRFPRLPTCLLHCVSAYPAPESDYNIALIPNLQAIFGIPTGLSDHSLDPILVPTMAVANGACVIEKHFCLSQNDKGLDDSIALPPDSFKQMVRAIREASCSEPDQIFKALTSDYGAERLQAVRGDGVKRLAKAETANYGRTNRSIHALRDLKAGVIINVDDIAVLRTEKVLRPGLPPDWRQHIIGRRTRNDIPAGEGVRFDDI